VVLTLAVLGAVCLADRGAIAQTGGAPPGFLGVRLDTTSDGHVRLVSVLPGSPAALAGLASGDCITEVGGERVSTTDDVIARVQAAHAGDRIQVVVLRSGRSQIIPVALDAAPAPGQVLTRFVGTQAPAWNLPTLDGGSVNLAALRGRVVLVYFWSVWCGACRMATPAVERWGQTFRDRGLSVVAISNDPIAELRSAGSSTGFSFPLVHDLDAKVGSEYWVSAVPTLFLIDRTGNIAQVMEGWDQAGARNTEAVIQRLLSANASSP
jgi:cytochrome c biogenesis protein CcmG, thiol:disulfide interchange protein DsbE